MAANSHSLDLELSSTQYAAIADGSQTGLDVATDITLAAWVKPESLTTNHAVVAKDDFGNNRRSYRLYVDSSGSVIFQLSNDGSTTVSKTSTSTIAPGVYFHLACTSIASTGAWVIYINGSADNSGTGMPSSIYNGTAPFALGASFNAGDGNPSNTFDGLIDEAIVTSDALSSGEILKLYQGYDPRTYLANMKGYWSLNNDYNDYSGNGNHLTSSGSPVFSSTVPFATYLGDEVSGFYHMSV